MNSGGPGAHVSRMHVLANDGDSSTWARRVQDDCARVDLRGAESREFVVFRRLRVDARRKSLGVALSAVVADALPRAERWRVGLDVEPLEGLRFASFDEYLAAASLAAAVGNARTEWCWQRAFERVGASPVDVDPAALWIEHVERLPGLCARLDGWGALAVVFRALSEAGTRRILRELHRDAEPSVHEGERTTPAPRALAPALRVPPRVASRWQPVLAAHGRADVRAELAGLLAWIDASAGQAPSLDSPVFDAWLAALAPSSRVVPDRPGRPDASHGFVAASATSVPAARELREIEARLAPRSTGAPRAHVDGVRPADPIRFPAADPELCSTRYAGIVYLVTLLSDAASALRIAAAGHPDRGRIGWILLSELAARLAADPEDELVLRVRALADEQRLNAAVADELIDALATDFAARLGPELWNPALLAVAGRVEFTPTHVETHVPLQSVRVEVRALGLDIDPGWVPWLARVVRIHYHASEEPLP